MERITPLFGALVQLVRIHACHAWGHGFESRTHRTFRDRQRIQRNKLLKSPTCYYVDGHDYVDLQ